MCAKKEKPTHPCTLCSQEGVKCPFEDDIECCEARWDWMVATALEGWGGAGK